MLQGNFENKMREELEKRTITPSATSWDKLERQLDGEAKKTRPLLWYLGIAASVILGLFFVLNPQSGNNELLKNNVITNIDTISIKQNIKKEVIEIAAEPKLTVIPTKKVDVRVATKTRKLKKKRNSNSVKLKASPIKEVAPIKEKTLITVATTVPVKISPSIVMQKTMLAQNTSEAEHLLHNAKQQIVQKNVKNKAQVSAEQLLLDVENRIELTFREKVFKTVKKNFNKVKTAVAERNKK